MKETNTEVSNVSEVEEQTKEVAQLGIFDQIEAVLQEMGPVHKDPEGNRLLLETRCAASDCIFGVHLHNDILTVFIQFPICVPLENRQSVANYIIEYNCERQLPQIDLCPDGKLAFRINTFVDPKVFNIDLFRRMAYLVTAFVEQDFAKLMSVAFGKSVEEDKVELN
jgi:hypothetical protein